MSRNQFRFRAAIVDDAEALGSLHVQVWRDTYEGWMCPDFLASLDEAEWAERWRECLTKDDRRRTVVALDMESENAVVGFASAGPCEDSDPDVTTELYVLNIDRDFHGTGMAGPLLEAVLLNRPAVLWVVEQNQRAQAFYRKYGFRIEGTKRWHASSGVYDIRMVRATSPAEQRNCRREQESDVNV
jgi:ribosomal protein S18 acetylase RimI-like enzyme